jgi:hypothetical protein
MIFGGASSLPVDFVFRSCSKVIEESNYDSVLVQDTIQSHGTRGRLGDRKVFVPLYIPNGTNQTKRDRTTHHVLLLLLLFCEYLFNINRQTSMNKSG